MKYTHEIVGTHGGGLLPKRALEHAPGEKSLVCIGLYRYVILVQGPLTLSFFLQIKGCPGITPF